MSTTTENKTNQHTHAAPLPNESGQRPREMKYTDQGNGEELVRRYGEHLRFVRSRGWLCWDGKRWRDDDCGQTMELAKDMTRCMRLEAATEPDRTRRDELWEHAIRSERRFAREQAIKDAQSDPRVVRRAEDFDRQPLLLNVKNGTVDLETGELRPHCTGDHITKLIPVDYDPDARSEVWDRFLADIFAEDSDLIAFFARGVGYSLSGSMREPAFFISYGSGANGKSTVYRAITQVLSDYVVDTPATTFLRKSYTGGVNNDQAALAGARFITASETEADQVLDMGLVKRITGGDRITARYLNKEFFSFMPQGKVWMATNNKPRIPENSPAIWRRIKLIPFAELIRGARG